VGTVIPFPGLPLPEHLLIEEFHLLGYKAIYSVESKHFNGLHGIVSKKIDLFITISVRNSNPYMMLA
jgi:hypothetical protein